MANEFIIKNGFRSQGNSEVTGSLNVTGGITGSLQGTAATASYFAGTVATASYSATASYVNPLSQNVIITGSLNITGSTTQIGSNNLLGQTNLSGSIIISGSVNALADMTLGGTFRLDPATDPGTVNVTASYLFTSASNTLTGFDLYYRQNDNLVKFKWLEGGISTGLLYGGVVSGSGTTIYVSSGSGIIMDSNATINKEVAPQFIYVTWTAYSASATYLTSSQNTYIYVDNAGVVRQQTNYFTETQYQEAICLGRVTHANYSAITGVGSNVQTTYDSDAQQSEFIRAFGPLKISGLTITGQAGSLRINIGAGQSYNLGGFYPQNPNHPSGYTSSAFVTASIARARLSGSNVVLDNNAGAFYTVIDPTKYDDGSGTLQSVPGGSYTIQRVFINPVSGRTTVYYGQAIYNNLVTALQSLNTDPFTEGVFTAKALVFAGYLVVKSGTSDITNTGDCQIIQAGIFRNTAGGSSTSGTVTLSLDNLSDVTTTTPSNGQALIYNSGTWINGTPSLATTASYVLNAVSASFAASASLAVTASTINIIDTTDNNFPFYITYAVATGSTQVIRAGGEGRYNPKFNTLTVTASYATQAISASYAPPTFPYTGSAIISGSLTVTGSLTANDPTNNKPVLSTSTRTVWGANTSESIDWDRKRLYATDGQASVFWNTRLLYDSNAISSTNWNLRQTYDASAALSTDWDKRQLIYSSAVVLDWKNAIFSGSVHGTASYATQALSASWAPGGGGTPGGSDTQIQFNGGGSFGGSTDFTFNKLSSSLSQGHNATDIGLYSHAQGAQTYTIGVASHAEGIGTRAGNNNGYLATAAIAGDIVLDSTYGDLTTAGLFVPGYIAAIDDSAYDDNHTYATISVLSCSYDGTNTHVYEPTGINTTTLVIASLSNQPSNVGTYLWGGGGAHAEGNTSISVGTYAHSEGNGQAFGTTSHAEGGGYAIGDGTHAEQAGYAYGNYSHAEGNGSTYAGYAHAEGSGQSGYLALAPNTPITAGVFELDPAYGDLTSTFAAGQFALINDDSGQINGIASTYLFEIASSTYNATPATEITFVDTTVATVNTKYAVGVYGNALPPGVALSQDGIGAFSHAEGENTQAIGRASHAAGFETRALGWYQSVVGQYNQPISTPGAFVIGDGVDDTTKHNLLVAAAGNVTISGSLLMSGSISNFIKGEATVDFGATPGSNYTTTTISTPFVTNNSNIHIYIMSTASAHHNAMEHQIFSLYGTVMPDNIIDNTSFDIVALSQLRLDGTFKVRYTINNN